MDILIRHAEGSLKTPLETIGPYGQNVGQPAFVYLIIGTVCLKIDGLVETYKEFDQRICAARSGVDTEDHVVKAREKLTSEFEEARAAFEAAMSKLQT